MNELYDFYEQLKSLIILCIPLENLMKGHETM